jgi:hypothetical protein
MSERLDVGAGDGANDRPHMDLYSFGSWLNEGPLSRHVAPKMVSLQPDQLQSF